MKSRVPPSAQCRSSIASRTGSPRPSWSSRPSSASKTRPWRARGSSSWRVPVPPSSGSSSASALRVAAGSAAAAGPARPRARGLGAGESARERPQRGDQRRVRDLRAAQLQALAAEDPHPARPRARLELAQQPRLADAGFAADEGEGRHAARGARERGVERLELGVAADEHQGGHAAGHVAHGRRPVPGPPVGEPPQRRPPGKGGCRRGFAPGRAGNAAGRGTITGRAGTRSVGDRERGSPFPGQRGWGGRALQRGGPRTARAARRTGAGATRHGGCGRRSRGGCGGLRWRR
jgi:hypothetical protein